MVGARGFESAFAKAPAGQALRPLGPEPRVGTTISECFRRFLDSGSNWVATGSRSVPWFHQLPPPIDYTAGGAKMVWTMNYEDRIVRDPQIVGGEPILKGTRVTLKTERRSKRRRAFRTCSKSDKMFRGCSLDKKQKMFLAMLTTSLAFETVKTG